MEPVRERRWNIREPDPLVVERLARECSIPLLMARLLANRGMSEPASASAFLSAALSDMHDPFLLSGMEQGVMRLVAALRNRERVCVYGDYDVDGITSVTLLISFFRHIGMDAYYQIPMRLEGGYGLSCDALKEAAAKGATVVVTVDCGITALQEAELALSMGIDLIITDHHMPGEVMPKAHAVINPMQRGRPFPFKGLAGVGVAFNLAAALRARLRAEGHFNGLQEPNLREYLDLVAMGTVADVVPLTDENRIFVKYGLNEMENTKRTGIRALKEVSGVSGQVSCGAVGFRLAPRLNACGRLDDAALGVELLLETDEERAKAIAAELDAGNTERQELEREILRQALEQVKGNPALRGRKSIVLASEGWHPGVIGIVASRLVEMYHRPTILIALENGNGKGSGRSIPSFHLHEALKACAGHLEKFGGHRQAAGLSIEEGTLAAFVEQFDDVAAGLLTPEDLTPELRIDAELQPSELTMELALLCASLAPFGMGNPEPVFMLSGMRVEDERILKEQHLKLKLSAGGASFEAIGFNMAAHRKESSLVDIVFSLDINEWNGRKRLQLKLKGIRESEAGDGA